MPRIHSFTQIPRLLFRYLLHFWCDIHLCCRRRRRCCSIVMHRLIVADLLVFEISPWAVINLFTINFRVSFELLSTLISGARRMKKSTNSWLLSRYGEIIILPVSLLLPRGLRKSHHGERKWTVRKGNRFDDTVSTSWMSYWHSTTNILLHGLQCFSFHCLYTAHVYWLFLVIGRVMINCRDALFYLCASQVGGGQNY